MKWLFAAYAIVWFVLFFYLFDLARKQSAIAREIERLKSKLGLGEKTAGG
jgi:CcmD family protein